MNEIYWLTIAVPCEDDGTATSAAGWLANVSGEGARVVAVQPEPPQGATIVGDLHEDDLA